MIDTARPGGEITNRRGYTLLELDDDMNQCLYGHEGDEGEDDTVAKGSGT